MSTKRFRYFLNLLFLLYAFLFASQAHAINLPIDGPHYDVTSLVYMSTDIVIANISQNQQHKFTATVAQTLYGSLHPNDQITGLDSSLTSYKPLEDGMKVVLFLDRRKAPVPVYPLRVDLIDSYGHVHEYQSNESGTYEVQAYNKDYGIVPIERVPTLEESLGMPSIEETTNRIATAVKAVEPIRSLLEKAPARDDVPALLHLLDRTSNDTKDCSLRLADAIGDRAFERLLSLNDSDVALRAYAVRGTYESQGLGFYGILNSDNPGFDFFHHAERGRYLLKVLLDRNEDLALRMAAVEILWNLNRFQRAAQQIPDASRKIVTNVSENPRLRALCLQFLSFDDSGTVTAIKRVYRSTRSEELRFAIEDASLAVSDSLYHSLDPSTGSTTSIVFPLAECACTRMTRHTNAAFGMKYREQRSVSQQHFNSNAHYLLTNLKTGQKVEIWREQIKTGQKVESGREQILYFSDWGSLFGEVKLFELRELPNFPAGEYSIALQLDGKPFPPGHSVKFKIRKTSKGIEVSMNDPKAEP